VRERHRRVRPKLETVPGHDDHQVACLLDEPTRRRLWDQLKRGEAPEEARETVGLEDSA
jgi:hypothetical protein